MEKSNFFGQCVGCNVYLLEAIEIWYQLNLIMHSTLKISLTILRLLRPLNRGAEYVMFFRCEHLLTCL